MRCAPSADRNKEPIAALLAKYPPFAGATKATCLEVASGTGQHCKHLAERFPHLIFQPTEFGGGSSGPEAPAYGDLSPVFASIVAHCGGMANVRRPIELDAAARTWPNDVEAATWDAIFACNVLHISPSSVTDGLLSGAERLLAPAGVLCIYGPFMVDGKHTAESNRAFDERLRAQNPQWGVRDSSLIAQEAKAKYGLQLIAREEMPANNFVLVFKRVAA